MIFVDCCNCDENLGMRAYTPDAWEKITCPKCKEAQWLRHSNLDATSYPEHMVEVDEKNKTIKLK